MWLDNNKNTNQECLQTCAMSTPLIVLRLFRVTKLKYYVGGKSQKATQNTINSDSGLSLKCIPVMIIVGLLLYCTTEQPWTEIINSSSGC